MSGPVVLVTGGSGMIGRALADKLTADYTLVCFDVTPPPGQSLFDSEHFMDVTSGMSVRYALENVIKQYGRKLAAVVHLAAPEDASGKDMPVHEDLAAEGTSRLLRMLDDFEVERFVFASTMFVHAPAEPGERIGESSPLDPRRACSRSKLEAERCIAAHRPPIPHTLLRMAGVYSGFGKHAGLLRQIDQIREQDFGSFIFPEDRRAAQSMLHLDDAADAIARTIDRRDSLGNGPILIGEPDPPSYEELQDQIGTLVWGDTWRALGLPRTLVRAAAWMEDKAPFDLPIKPFETLAPTDHFALDVGHARRVLGWEPRHRIQDQLPNLIETLMEYPVAWERANEPSSPDPVPSLRLSGARAVPDRDHSPSGHGG